MTIDLFFAEVKGLCDTSQDEFAIEMACEAPQK